MKKIISIFLSLIIVVFTLFSLRAYYLVKNIDISSLKKCHKTKMFKVYLCPGGKNYSRLPQISKHFLDLIIIAEDASFYSHQGFDWHEIKQSFRANLRSLSYLRGGSTITQQLTKNVFLSPEKSIERKFIEAFLAQKIEKTYSKKVILERYVNVIEFGKNIFGVKSAAQYYFNKLPKNLTILESTFLVYLVPSPKKYSAVFPKKKLSKYAHQRISTLLRKLKLYKKISPQQYEYYKARISEFPWVTTKNYTNDIEADLFMPTNTLKTRNKDHKVPDEVIQKRIDEEIENEINLENQIIEDDTFETSPKGNELPADFDEDRD